MDVAYYPGCSLHGTAREYDASTAKVTRQLGVGLQELDDWNCCGASSAHMTSDDLAFSLAARNLNIADKTGLDLVIPCAACFQRLKRAEKKLLAGEKPQGVPAEYSGKHSVKYLVDFVWEDIGETSIKNKVKRPLTGLKAVCYYGCLTVRPPHITDARHPEDPVAMDKIVRSLGVTVINWSFKTECCGGNLRLTRPEIGIRLTDRIVSMAREAGADCIIAGCPLCQSNLDMGQMDGARDNSPALPVFYFTELIGLAFGEDTRGWLRGHSVNPRPLLEQLKLV